MSRIEQAITAAQTALQEAQNLPDTDEQKAVKVASAQSQLDTLNARKTDIEAEINDAVRGRVPDAEKTGKEAERKALASRLGVPLEKLDEELGKIEEERKSRQSETERLQGEFKAATERAEKAEKERDSFKERFENLIKEREVERALLSEDLSVKPERIKAAMRNADMSLVKLDESGKVEGAKEAAEAAKKDAPELFRDAEAEQQGPGPSRQVPPTPPGKKGKDGKSSGWRPPRVRPGQS